MIDQPSLRQYNTNKKILIAVIVLAGSAMALHAVQPVPLTELRAIAELPRVAACRQIPVSVEGTVTLAPTAEGDLYVQQNGWAVLVRTSARTQLMPGDRVRLQGTTRCGFRPFVQATEIALLGHDSLPKPIVVTYTDMIQGRSDAVLVSVRGVLRSADQNDSKDPAHREATLRLQTDTGPVDAIVRNTDSATLQPLLDAEVEMTGIADARHDEKLQRIGAVLYVGAPSNIRVLKYSSRDPWSLPPTPIDTVLSAFRIQNFTRRVRVHGTVTYAEQGQGVVLQDGAHSLWVKTQSFATVPVGEEVDAIGFPVVNDGSLMLSGSEVRDTGKHAPLAPQSVDWRELTTGRHYFDLVSVEGLVTMEMGSATQDKYVLAAGGSLFSVNLRHRPTQDSGSNEPLKPVPVGSRIRVTGICLQNDASLFNDKAAFNILLRSADDIQILKGPSLLNMRNLGISLTFLLLMLVAVSIRSWSLERKVRHQTAALAYSERRRSRILEEINGSIPLAEIVEQTAELVSFRLKGAPCWVEISGGAQLGNKPEKVQGHRIESREIPARSGPSLGTIFVAFDPRVRPGSDSAEALAMAAGLIELAIETRRLYTDLLHRSEFDLLTDVQNRFSLERCLDEQIQIARASASIFGLVYIDLNDFKQVNDLCGHHVGDQYLQEVALRMKRQLRPSDRLARLGGDEFAVMVTEVRSRAQMEEIAMRLERSFDEPFQIGDCLMEGSAAIGIALYPEDARSRHGLLRAADAAMYAAKRNRANAAQDHPA
jgi:diguanylate cyclase (GGDEF)-like protein